MLGRPKGSVKRRPGRRVKSFRVDPILSVEFGRFCAARGLVQETVLEGCMWWVMTLAADEREDILSNAASWLDRQYRPSRRARPGGRSRRS